MADYTEHAINRTGAVQSKTCIYLLVFHTRSCRNSPAPGQNESWEKVRFRFREQRNRKGQTEVSVKQNSSCTAERMMRWELFIARFISAMSDGWKKQQPSNSSVKGEGIGRMQKCRAGRGWFFLIFFFYCLCTSHLIDTAKLARLIVSYLLDTAKILCMRLLNNGKGFSELLLML